ncbi:MAG: hypothetical protein OXB89_07500 [Anaerolineaceae bacterium]|nr:hypothetical protein [Anaerolineaceae bacterium]
MAPGSSLPVLYKEVVLLKDFPKEKLRKGDRALYIHELPGVNGSEDGAILELYNNSRTGRGLATVPVSAIAAPNHNE